MPNENCEWTPGPWTVVEPDSFSNKYPVALVATGQCWEHGSRLIASGFRPDEPEASANMRLIAAVPDLYTALDDLTDITVCIDGPIGTDPQFFSDLRERTRRALAVMAKARGEKPSC